MADWLDSGKVASMAAKKVGVKVVPLVVEMVAVKAVPLAVEKADLRVVQMDKRSPSHSNCQQKLQEQQGGTNKAFFRRKLFGPFYFVSKLKIIKTRKLILIFKRFVILQNF